MFCQFSKIRTKCKFHFNNTLYLTLGLENRYFGNHDPISYILIILMCYHDTFQYCISSFYKFLIMFQGPKQYKLFWTDPCYLLNQGPNIIMCGHICIFYNKRPMCRVQTYLLSNQSSPLVIIGINPPQQIIRSSTDNCASLNY